MLPKQIQMKNFGPYVDETVDFEALLSGGLFLITGDTGAGKTTILDAMSFALFGKTTGEKRMAKEFRSHFADIEAKCEVKFTFTHQNYTYIITRQPTMEIQKRNGKVSNPKAKAYLEIFDEKGQLMDTKSGVKKVDAFMSELLQLTSEQFNQIILLPQGKFQEFLISDSENKTQILRTIFNTQLYQQLTDTIKQNYLQKEKLVNHQVEQLQRLSQQLNAFDGEELPVSTEAISLEKWPERMLQILSSQKDQLTEQSTQLEKAKHNNAELQTTFHQAQTIFNQQAEGQRLLAQQASLQSQADKIATLQTKIQNLNWLNQQRHDLEQYTKEQQKLQLFKKNQQQTCQQLAQNEGEWQIFRQQESTRNAWREKMAENEQQKFQLEALMPIAEAFVAQQKILHASQEKFEHEKEKEHALEQQIQKHQMQLADTEEAWGVCNAQIQEYTQATEEVSHLQNWLSADEQIQQLKAQQQELLESLSQIEKQKTCQLQKITHTKQQLEHQRQTNIELLSTRLQRLLKPGEPCPVCGSREHPVIGPVHEDKQALIENEQQLQALEHELQQAQNQLGRYETQDIQTQQQQAKNAEQIEQLIATQKQIMEQFLSQVHFTGEWPAFQELQAANPSARQIEQFIDAFKQQFKQSTQQSKVLQATIAQEKASLIEHQKDYTQKQAKNQQLQKELIEQESQLKSYEQRLSGRTLATLQASLAQLTQEISQLSQQLEMAANQEQTLKTTHVRLETQKQSLADSINQQEKICQQLKEQVREIYLEIDQKFHRQCYEVWQQGQVVDITDLWESVQDLPAMQQRVQQHQEESHYVKTRLTELAAIMEQPPVDLQPLNERLEKSSQQVEQLMQTISKQQFIYEQNQQINKEYTDLLTKNQQTIVEVQSFARLAKGMTGENALKLSLERYCLQVYFEKVLQLANVRLQDLTQGRYRLSIGTEKGRTSRSTGLELMIFDDHTGEERRVQTLSGGESFIVSLALSLSLADVIQQQSGGIQIEALFIDEGFGTLDEQTLQLAIQTLAQLEGQGQLIGIISHVRELKEQIPRQIQVKKQGNGQSKITIHS